MPKKYNQNLIWLFIILITVSFLACDGDNPTKPKNPPTITLFEATPANISPGDSTLLSYAVTLADSVKLFPDNFKLADPESGSVYRKPGLPIEYILVAYNENGRDSATVTVNVSVFVILNGLYYKGLMNSATLTPPIALQVLDSQSVPIQDVWIKASLLEGDGTLAADSVQPGADDTALVEYNFNGSLGHAVIQTWVEGVDTASLFVRAKTIIPGDLFQGQYILYRDTFALIQEFNGAPDAVVNPEPGSGYLVLDYEANDSVVFIIGEVGAINGVVSAMDTVFTILITGTIGGSTAEGITVGATYPELYAAYGAPQTSGAYPSYPDDTVLYYDSLGLKFWCNKSDTVVNQIDLMPPNTPLSLGDGSPVKRREQISTNARNYRLIIP